MEKISADYFRINSPYGIIIRLSDLYYNWFNRHYLSLGKNSKDFLPFSELPEFVEKLKDVSVLDNLRSYAFNNRVSGMDMEEKYIEGGKYVRIWLYSDRYFPFNSKGIIKSNMNRYESVLSEIERIIG